MSSTAVGAAGAQSILIRREGDTVIVTLNRPEKMNALNAGLVDELLSVVQSSYSDGARLLVLQGAGRNFSAGFDFGDFEEASEAELVLRFIRIEQLLQALYYAPYHTLGLAHGKNFGAGVDLLCCCSQRIAVNSSTFRMPGLRFGLVLGIRRLMQRIGMDAARTLLQQSHTFDAEEAVSIGFLNEVAQQEQWPAVVRNAAQAGAALSPEAVAALFRVTAPDTRSEDLADLVLSAARPGLKDRIRRYRAQS